MSITTCYFGDLPDWIDRDQLSNNGSGKEYATYILIEDGDYKACYSDAMEPEDARFGRALKWVTKELERMAAKQSETAKVRDEWCAEFVKARDALTRIARYDDEPIWKDDRDDAANGMLRIARVALGEEEE